MTDDLPHSLGLDAWSPEQLQALIRVANQLYFRTGAWNTVTWMGCRVVKSPTDLWAYQELIHRTEPDVLVETGTLDGGSALFFAHCMDHVGHGRVLTVDIEERQGRPRHPRIEYVTGDSVAAEVLERVQREIEGLTRVMVVLDSSHRSSHVLAELSAYAPMVTVGQYLVVEDTAFDGWPAWPEFGPGPATALATFLESNQEFAVDHSCTRQLLSLAPGGFLRRVSLDEGS